MVGVLKFKKCLMYCEKVVWESFIFSV
jgi:hypothetical protein